MPPSALTLASASLRVDDASLPVMTNSLPASGRSPAFAWDGSSSSFTPAFFSLSMMFRLPSCRKKAAMLSEILGPMDGMLCSSSSVAPASLSRLRYRDASSVAVSPPTLGMPRAKRTLASGRTLLPSMDFSTLSALFSPIRSSPSNCSRVM